MLKKEKENDDNFLAMKKGMTLKTLAFQKQKEKQQKQNSYLKNKTSMKTKIVKSFQREWRNKKLHKKITIMWMTKLPVTTLETGRQGTKA